MEFKRKFLSLAFPVVHVLCIHDSTEHYLGYYKIQFIFGKQNEHT